MSWSVNSNGNDLLYLVSSKMEGKGSPCGHTVQSGSFLEPANGQGDFQRLEEIIEDSSSNFWQDVLEAGGGGVGRRHTPGDGNTLTS